MSYADALFVNTCEKILHEGMSDENFNVRPKWADGTPAHTKKILYHCAKYPLAKNSIPVMTLRKAAFKNAIDEILWIYQKKSNVISQLRNPKIWADWDVGNGSIGKAYGYQVAIINKHHKLSKEELNSGEVHDKVLEELKQYPSHNINYHDGYLYLDQMDAVLWDLRHNPGSRSIIINLYNVADLCEMGLHPCAYSLTLNVTEKDGKRYLNGLLNQRSQDMLTANNWNVMQYSVLLQMIAQCVDMLPGTLCHMIGDCHIYDRHEKMVRQLIDSFYRGKYHDNPKFWINPEVTDFYKFTVDDFKLIDYEYAEFDQKIPVAI